MHRKNPDTEPMAIEPATKKTPSDDQASFAETALKLSGKSEDEARRTGVIDKADDQVEALFKPQYQTINSPAHRAVWDRGVPVEMFQAKSIETPADTQQVMDDSVDLIRNHRLNGTLLDENGKIPDSVMEELGERGYWGLLVDRDYGGKKTAFRNFAPFLTRMAMEDPTVAGLASVHGCIGAVDPVSSFGNDEQKQRFLPDLASGKRLSAFALTEPWAGSDLTALRTTAVLDGDHYVVNGEKLFITNVTEGRTIGLVCLIDNAPAVLVCDLPKEQNENFQLKRYGIYALNRSCNCGIVFKEFRVPKENLLQPKRGNGLTIAYHGLNLGRISLCANAAGTMRLMMASMIPWAKFRVTYGEAIASRELVTRRLGRLGGLIVAADALTEWCSWLIDEGYRGEMECIIAKIFGSEAQKEAAIELFMKTHGGRSFLHGHMFGDNVHDFLAPCIYEGEGEMLGMAFFKSLVKHHGTKFFEPVGKALAAAGIKTMNPANPAHLWALRKVMPPYASWLIKETVMPNPRPQLPSMPGSLSKYASWACQKLQASKLSIDSNMRKHQLKLADRQCRIAADSHQVQSLITMLATSLYAARKSDDIVTHAAEVVCRDMQREINGEHASDRDFRHCTKLGAAIANGQFKSIAGVEPDTIMMGY